MSEPPWAVGCSYTLSCTSTALIQSCRGQEWRRGLIQCRKWLETHESEKRSLYQIFQYDTNILFSGFWVSVTETCSLSVRKTHFWVKQCTEQLSCCVCVSVMDVLYTVVFFQYLAELTGCQEIKELCLKARWQSYESALWLFLWMKWSQSALSSWLWCFQSVFVTLLVVLVSQLHVNSGLFWPLWLRLCPRLCPIVCGFLLSYERARIVNQTPARMFDGTSPTCFWKSVFSLFSNQTGMCTYMYREYFETEISVPYWMVTITIQPH